MTRQYQVFYKRGTGPFNTLTPNAHRPLYDREAVTKAVTFIRDNPEIEGVAVRCGDEAFNVIAFQQEAIAPNAFLFIGPTDVDAFPAAFVPGDEGGQ